MSIYFNNAATTWPKPDCVARAMSDFLGSGGANLGRGTASARDLGTMGLVLECRERAARLLGGYENASPVYVTFTANITESLHVHGTQRRDAPAAPPGKGRRRSGDPALRPAGLS